MADLVTVVGDFGMADDRPAEGRVRFAPYLDAVLAAPDPMLVTRARVEAELDAQGAFSVELIGSHDPGWQTTGPVPYLVRWTVSGSYAERIVVLPGGPGPHDLFTLVDLAEPPTIVPTPIPGPTAVSADPGNVATLGSDDLIFVSPTVGGVTDHGVLSGLSDPDHPIAAVQGLQAALDGKAAAGHTHTPAQVGAEPAGSVAAHVGAPDPHPQYVTPAELVAGNNIALDKVTTPGSVTIEATVTDGEAGPPNVLTVAATNTLAPGTPAAVTIAGSSPSQALTFGIPAGVAGEPGPEGPPGWAVATFSAVWRWVTKTTDANTAGQVGNNNAGTTWAATTININKQRDDNGDTSYRLSQLVAGDELRIALKTDYQRFGSYILTGPGVLTAGSYYAFPVVLNRSAGAEPAGNSEVWVSAHTQTADLVAVLDAKGDLIAGTGPDVAARVPVGSDGQILTADSAQATGIKWAAPAAGGSLIRSGSGAPADALGNVGDYYLDTTARILYGPKAAAGSPGPDETVTHDTSGYSGSFNARMFGVKFRFTVAGTVSAIRVYRLAASSSGTAVAEVYLFTGAGTMLASINTSVAMTTGWNTVPLAAPVSVAAGTTYIAAAYSTGGSNNFGLTGGTFAGQTVGNVTAIANGVDGPNATYDDTRDTAPLTDLGAKTSGVSLVFNSAPPPIWPVALAGIPPGGTTNQFLKKTSISDYAVGWVT